MAKVTIDHGVKSRGIGMALATKFFWNVLQVHREFVEGRLGSNIVGTVATMVRKGTDSRIDKDFSGIVSLQW